MILTSLLSLVSSFLTNTLLYFAGKLVINSRRFLLYLGVNAPEHVTDGEIKNTDDTQAANKTLKLASYKDNKIAIEDILITIGLLIQAIAIVSMAVEITVTLLAISRLADASTTGGNSISR